MTEKTKKPEKEWRKLLTDEEFHILWEKGTERAFTGEYWNHFEKGKYLCAGCGVELFDSSLKFASECGWPSFSQPSIEENIETETDTSFGMIRTEVLCSNCGGHLGSESSDLVKRVDECISYLSHHEKINIVEKKSNR